MSPTSKRTYRYNNFECGHETTTTPEEVSKIYHQMMTDQGYKLIKVENGGNYYVEAEN